LDRAGGVLALDVDALVGRELELHVVIEQTAIGCV
jgi:Na+-translocating ferredoxin:NAD+ oxidoreductase RNF subunit RnfB